MENNNSMYGKSKYDSLFYNFLNKKKKDYECI